MKLAALLLGLALLGASAEASEVDAVVDRVTSAYGGSEALQKVAAFRVDTEVQSQMQGPGRARRDFQAPDRLRVEIDYARSKEVRVLDGERGWRGDAGRLARVEGAPRLAMIYQMLRSTVPDSLVRYRGRLVDRGTKSRDGAEYRVLGLPWSQELDLNFWVDPASHRVVWVEGALQAGPMQTSFATRFEDFRTVGGLLYPFAEENYAGGQHTGTTTVRSVVFAPKDLGPFDPTRL